MISKMLSEITSVITKGTTPTSVGCSFSKNGINYIKSESITSSRTLDKSKYAFISEETHQKLKRSQIKENDILFSMAGMFFGKTGIVQADDVPANTNQAVAIIRIVPEQANYLYVYYYLNQKNIVTWINYLSGQSAQPNINLKQIGEIEIPLPDRIIQDTIVEMLSAIDSRIELNTAINENLESQAQAIFKSWFVDFEPFGGVMPEDWRTGSLSEICGYSKDKVNIEDLTLDTYYSTENMQPNRQGAVQATALPTIKQTIACKKGDVLISNIRPYFKKIIYCFADCGCSTDVLCFVPNKSEYSAFLYCALYSDKFFDYMVAGSKGTKMPRGDKQQIMMYPICIPSTEYVEQFSKIVAPMLETVYTNRLEANDLAILRDTLLPKLMKGEIDVSEVKI